MPNSDFGLVRDPIQSVTQVSPTIAGGQTTYRMTFYSGKTFDFNVYNGANGIGQIRTYTFSNINTTSKWEILTAWVADRFDNLLGLVLNCENGMKYRLHADMQDDTVTPKDISIFYSNGKSSASPFTENDPILIYPNLFSSSASAGELWNCDVTVLYLDTSIQAPTYPTLSLTVGQDNAAIIQWQGNWMLERCTLAFFNLSAPSTDICHIDVIWDGQTENYICSNKTYQNDADYISTAEVSYGNEYTSENNIYVETNSDPNNQFVFDPSVHGVRVRYGYFGKMDASFIWVL